MNVRSARQKHRHFYRFGLDLRGYGIGNSGVRFTPRFIMREKGNESVARICESAEQMQKRRLIK